MTSIKYPLYNMNHIEFEKLVALICDDILGTGTIIFSKGKDGGRDAKFTGTANQYPSEVNPWNGRFIIQAKHTTKPEASCTDSEFKTILGNEILSLQKLKDDGKVDYYLLFTNRKLSGLQDPKIEDILNQEVDVKNNVLGEERIQLWLQKSPKIVKTLGLNSLLLPLQFYEKDLQEIVIAFSETDIPKEELRIRQIDLAKIPIEEENRLNDLSEIYFDNVLKQSFSDFEEIGSFLEDTKNEEYKSKYDNTISDLQEEIMINWDDYASFEDILNHLYKLALDSTNNQLLVNRRLLRTFLHYMYFNCDIGKKV